MCFLPTMTQESLFLVDLDTSVDETQDTMVILQQRMAVLEATNALLLQRLNEVENVLNATTETVQDHDVDIQGINLNYSIT